MAPEEMAAFSGLPRSGDHVMICPALLSHVKSAVEADTNIMKHVRKAREERELRRGKKKPPQNSGDK